MENLTSKERLARCYFHKEVDRPSVFCRNQFHNETPDATYNDLVKLINEKSDLKFEWNARRFLTPYSFKIEKEPSSAEFERQKTIINTPKGDLIQSDLLGLKGQPGYTEKHLLETREDAEKYLSLPLPKFNVKEDIHFELLKKAGDRGIVSAFLGGNPAGSVVPLFGTERFAMVSITERDIIHELMERELKILSNMVKVLIDRKILPFFGMNGEEYIVPPIHGPEDFSDFNVKYDKPLVDLIHNAKGSLHIHSHGSIKKVLNGFLDIGVDVLHPFEPPPMGDITSKEAKEIIKGKICFEGNIQIADMYEKSPENIKEQVHSLIKEVFYDKEGLIVCASASASASPYIANEGKTCFENYQAMVETVLSYK